jgi:hypothetical protein
MPRGHQRSRSPRLIAASAGRGNIGFWASRMTGEKQRPVAHSKTAEAGAIAGATEQPNSAGAEAIPAKYLI